MTTRKKLEGNGLWESSRMMLPEHKELIIRRQLEESRREKPLLDAQEIELIEHALAESYYVHRTVTLKLYDEYAEMERTGVVSVILTHKREIKFTTRPGEWEWIKIEDIISIQ
ncbi:YolD-like family protein [Paenibacillus campinasensis]|uniref:YolD-like family protein n=1 Tax=Paenibacillus campinasensis TaxID=66347 RepID=A0A268EI91_9BACL|nr:YolD-like family protein [Paenibacillus campinasensis]PAD72857.1 hypothetical protein CHH67_21355 [Paenibacillus campinasensis]